MRDQITAESKVKHKLSQGHSSLLVTDPRLSSVSISSTLLLSTPPCMSAGGTVANENASELVRTSSSLVQSSSLPASSEQILVLKKKTPRGLDPVVLLGLVEAALLLK
ncbi:hypothetical protein PoB_007483500 [Plakobranchus ocellatus]|uniref:Uncharacterized protein n=1 Tax=Plakobranchus ocellatus TaxID=259542 RepID=A0AAV4DW90_9GAST|nr:hypothetical protein PoB_007483500 [Plakobranchus ocellatus]